MLMTLLLLLLGMVVVVIGKQVGGPGGRGGGEGARERHGKSGTAKGILASPCIALHARINALPQWFMCMSPGRVTRSAWAEMNSY